MALALKRCLGEELLYTSPLEFEFLRSIRLQVSLPSNNKTRGHSRNEADRMIRGWETDTASGINRLVAFDMDAVLQLSKSYSLKLTTPGGHRAMEMFHNATAIHLGAQKFLAFDDRQRRLADLSSTSAQGCISTTWGSSVGRNATKMLFSALGRYH